MAWALRKIEKEKPAAGKTDYWRGFWRSGWDSNPRNLAVQLISSLNPSCYITVCRPVWAKRIPYGRKEAYLIMNEEEKRCFDEAALMESIDESVL